MRIIRIQAFFLLALLIIASSANAQDAVLDAKLEKQVEKVFRYPSSKKQLNKLSFYYIEANNADLTRLASLRESGNPEVWYEVYSLYKRLSQRQEMVGQLPGSSLNKIGFRKADYKKDMEAARKNAAAFLYAHAGKLLQSGQKKDAQLAYDELFLIARLYEEYRDLDLMLRRAAIAGADNLKLEVHNKTGKKLNKDIVSSMKYSFRGLATTSAAGKDAQYNFTIRLILTDIVVTKPQLKTKQYIEERDIYDDDMLVVDTISCTVTENYQRKAASLKGKIELIDQKKNQVINNVPIGVESVFLHKYATVTGNIDACGPETREMLLKKEVEYPTNEVLVMDAVQKFTEKVSQVVMPPEPPR